jgi:hypothetical protein
MILPTKNQIESTISNNLLFINDKLIKHPAFSALLKMLKQEHITFSSPEILIEEATKNIIIKGTSSLLEIPILSADFYIYEDAKDHYQFEWHGTLTRITLGYLQEIGILEPQSLNSIDALFSEGYNQVDFIFTSHDRAFAIEVHKSNITFQLPELGISLEKIGFFYERSLDRRIKSTYRLYSNIKIGSTTIATEIELPAGNNLDTVCWTIRTNHLIILNKGLADILSFLQGQAIMKELIGNQLSSYLPEVITKIPTFGITDLTIQFNPQKKSIQIVEFLIQSLHDFEILPGFSLSNIGVHVFMTFMDKRTSCDLGLSGQFIYKEAIHAEINIELPLNTKDDWKIALDGDIDLEKLQDLEAFPFIKIESLNIPSAWLQVKNIRVQRLEAIFNPIKRKIKSVSFAIELKAQSQLIPGIKLKDPYLEFNLTFN